MKKYVLKKATIDSSESQQEKDFSAELNATQLAAVNFNEGPLLVIAGAGSGKTRTLVYRVARLVSAGVNPEAILLLTFTRKAAQEMLRRASQILDYRCSNVSGGTFHSFANAVLRKYATHIGFSENFSILDRSDAEDLINIIRKDLGFGKSDKRFPKKGTVISIIGKAINTQKTIENILSTEYPQYIELAEAITKIALRYIEEKQQIQVMDYDDLLIYLRKLLAEHEAIRKELSQKFKYIMVDEYQDTNAIQADLVALLAAEHHNVMVVGDDAQSIYSFRGANFKNIMDFPQLFPEAQVIKLEENYRSTQPILDLTNNLISFASERYTKNLFTRNAHGEKPIYIETQSENEQSQFICQKVLELREEGVSLNQIAVLFRSGWHSNDLEVELKARNIPFVKFGGFKFIETAHVKDVIALIRLVFNRADIISWNRILLMLEGLGPKGASQIIELIQTHTGNFQDLDITQHKKKKFYLDLQDLFKVLDKLTPNSKPVQALSEILKYYKPLFKLKYEDYTKRQADLESIESIVERYETIEKFLSEMSLEPPETSQTDSLPATEDESKLILSTIHSAKGLEWHTVFILSAVDGYLPSFQSLGDRSQIEEERRLLYVALTRAQHNLFVIKPNLDHASSGYYRYSGMSFSKLSRFLEEGNIITQFAEKWSLVAEENGIEVALNTEVDSRKYCF